MRVFNRLLVFAVGLACAVVGFVAIAEAAWTGLGYHFLWFSGSAWLHTLRTTAYSQRSVAVGAAIAALVGLALLLAELRPWRKRLVRLSQDGSRVVWLLHRRSTESLLRRRLQRQVPVSPITARLRVGALRWKLSLRAQAARSTAPVLQGAGEEELRRLGAPARSSVAVRTTQKAQSVE